MEWFIEILKVVISSGVVFAGYIIVDRREKRKEKKAESDQLADFKKEMIQTLSDHRTEYLKGIDEVKDSITELRATSQQTQAVMELRLEYMTNGFNDMKVEVREHNNFAKRMPVVEEQIRVANHRISDLENK